VIDNSVMNLAVSRLAGRGHTAYSFRIERRFSFVEQGYVIDNSVMKSAVLRLAGRGSLPTRLASPI
jgi:hypothetical protein